MLDASAFDAAWKAWGAAIGGRNQVGALETAIEAYLAASSPPVRAEQTTSDGRDRQVRGAGSVSAGQPGDPNAAPGQPAAEIATGPPSEPPVRADAIQRAVYAAVHHERRVGLEKHPSLVAGRVTDILAGRTPVDAEDEPPPDEFALPDGVELGPLPPVRADEGPLEAPESVVVAWAREMYRQDTKCGNADSETDFADLPYEERESRLCEAEANVLFIMDRLAAPPVRETEGLREVLCDTCGGKAWVSKSKLSDEVIRVEPCPACNPDGTISSPLFEVPDAR